MRRGIALRVEVACIRAKQLVWISAIILPRGAGSGKRNEGRYDVGWAQVLTLTNPFSIGTIKVVSCSFMNHVRDIWQARDRYDDIPSSLRHASL
jgi:hypothetical protein